MKLRRKILLCLVVVSGFTIAVAWLLLTNIRPACGSSNDSIKRVEYWVDGFASEFWKTVVKNGRTLPSPKEFDVYAKPWKERWADIADIRYFMQGGEDWLSLPAYVCVLSVGLKPISTTNEPQSWLILKPSSGNIRTTVGDLQYRLILLHSALWRFNRTYAKYPITLAELVASENGYGIDERITGLNAQEKVMYRSYPKGYALYVTDLRAPTGESEQWTAEAFPPAIEEQLLAMKWRYVDWVDKQK